MRPLVHELETQFSPEHLTERLLDQPGVVLLRSSLFDSPQAARYSFVAARPFFVFRSFGSRCQLASEGTRATHFGNPWQLLNSLMSRYELLDELDLPFPLGGCFGYWGYDLKNFVEPRLPRAAVDDLELPDCHVGFYDSVIVFDHPLAKTWIVSTGLMSDGSRSEARARDQLEWWLARFGGSTEPGSPGQSPATPGQGRPVAQHRPETSSSRLAPLSDPLLAPTAGANPMQLSPGAAPDPAPVASSFSRSAFLSAVDRAQRYIRLGDIYQVNLAQRLAAPLPHAPWDFYQHLAAVSPAPFAAYLDCGDLQIASSSPELFLRLSGRHVRTRPIKGTRPRSTDPTRDAQLTYELQTSAKEMAELVMITDLLRNDLGRFCEYGSIQVPELVRLERYPQVHHLVSTVEGRLQPGVTHFDAFAHCFPGGSVTGAPKIRAMEIIDQLEPVTRGPYTGCLGYIGFNRESQLSILIRAAVCKEKTVFFHVGAGIVADSLPAAEYEETLAKAAGFYAALQMQSTRPAGLPRPSTRFPD